MTISRSASREQLGVLYESARVVASGENVQVILDNILDLLLLQFKFDLCVVRILDEKSRNLTVRSQRGIRITSYNVCYTKLLRPCCGTPRAY